jgi:GH43 family beta-xylosidase
MLNKHRFYGLIAATLIGLDGMALARAAPSASSWVNPIVPQRADPQVFLHSDGYYYMMATVPEYDRLELRRARTLAGLASTTPKTVWQPHATGVMAAPIWAPEMHFIDGKWYIYFSAGEAGKPWDRIRVYALQNGSANPLEGDWTEKGQVKTPWDTFTLDPTSFEHKGVRYFVWTQVEPGVLGSNIYIAKMDSPTSIAGTPAVISRPDLEWEARGGVWVNEGPAVLVRKGKVFIAYSASATDANYCMGLLTADADADLLDPKSWHKAKEPVLKSNAATSQYGPGHNSFTTTPDGKTDILVYHSRNYEKIEGGALANPDRATRAQIIRWKPDGTPDFGVPVADGPYPSGKTK